MKLKKGGKQILISCVLLLILTVVAWSQQPVKVVTGSTTAVTVASGSVVSGAIADGAMVTIGTKADAKSTATDTTSLSIMSVLKEISAMEQAPAARAVTNAGTFPVQATVTALPVDVTPATQNITVVDSASTSTPGFQNQNAITGTPTAGSAASFAIANFDTIRVQVNGTWTGTLAPEASPDGGTTWYVSACHLPGTSYTSASMTASFSCTANVAGATNFRVRATQAITGTAVITVTESKSPSTIFVANPITLRDPTTQSISNAIKAGGTPATTNDTALVATLSPNQPQFTTPLNTRDVLGQQILAAVQQQRVRGSFGETLRSVNGALAVAPMQLDPCSGVKVSIPISQTANTRYVIGAGHRIFICSIMLVGADAENVSLVEGTGSTCATGTLATIGGASAATGPNMAANGGFTLGNGQGTIASTNISGNDLCAFQSASGRVAGVMTISYGQ